MLQAVLADRFKLKVHHEKRELPIYALVVAKGGSKLKQADPKDTYPNGLKGSDGIAHPGSLWSRNGNLTGQGVPLASLTGFIGGQASPHGRRPDGPDRELRLHHGLDAGGPAGDKRGMTTGRGRTPHLRSLPRCRSNWG